MEDTVIEQQVGEALRELAAITPVQEINEAHNGLAQEMDGDKAGDP